MKQPSDGKVVEIEIRAASHGITMESALEISNAQKHRGNITLKC